MKKRIGLLAFVSVLGFVVLARDVLLTKAAEVYVCRKMTSQGWSFESVEREKNTLHVKNLSYQGPSGHLLIEEADVAFHFSLLPLQLQPTVLISDMLVEVLEETKSSDDSLLGLFFCLGDPRLDLKLSIAQGEARGIMKEPFAFSFKPGIEKKEIGTLSIQDLEKKEFLSVHFNWEGESLVSEVEIQRGKASDLIELVSFMQSSALRGWGQGQGIVSASIKSRFHLERGLEEMEGKMDLQEISFSHTALGIHLLSESLKGTLLFSPDRLKEKQDSFWKRVELFLTFEDTSLSIERKDLQLGACEALGEIRLTPQEDPYLKMGGKILSKGQLIPFEVEGKGQLLDKGAFWLQTGADFFPSKRESHFAVSFSQNEQKENFLQIDYKEVSQEVFNILALAFPLFHLPECSMQAGVVEGTCMGSFKQGLLKTLTFSECKAEGLVFSIPSQNLALSSERILFSGGLEQNEKGLLELSALDADVTKAGLSMQNKEMFRSLSANIGVRLGEFIPSHVEGFYQGIWGSANILDASAPGLIHVECKALASDLMHKIWDKKIPGDPASPISLTLDVASQEGKACGTALIRLSSSGATEEIELDISLHKEITRRVKDLFSPWDLSSFRGFFKTNKISSETSQAWIRPLLGTLAFKGFLAGEGQFDRKGISMEISHADLSLSDGSWDMSAQLGSETKKVHVAYEYQEGLWKGTVPVEQLHVQNSKLKIDATVQNSLFFFEGDQLWTDHVETEVFGSKLLATFLIDKSGVHIASKAFEGTLASLYPLLTRSVPSISSWGLNGVFSVADHGCVLEGKKQGDLWQWDWKASIGLKDLACDLGKKGKIHQGKMRLETNAAGDFKCKDIQGMYSLEKSHCSFAMTDIHASSALSAPTDFSLLAKDDKREWAYLQGKVEKRKEGVVISLSPHCHLLGLVIDVAPFMINQQFACSPLKVSSHIKLEQLPSYFTMWKEMGLPIGAASFVGDCRGTLQLQAVYDLQKSAWKASFQSPEIAYKQDVLGKVSGMLVKEGKQIKLDSCHIGPWNLKGSLDLLATEWSVPSFEVEWPEGKCLIQGKYNPSSSKLQISTFSAVLIHKEKGSIQLQGNFEGVYLQEISSLQGRGSSRLMVSLPPSFGIGIESMKEIPFVFDSKKGIQIEKSQWELTSSNKQRLSKINTKAITYVIGEKRLTLQEGSLSLSKESYKTLQNIPLLREAIKDVHIDQEIEVQGDLDLSPLHKKISVALSNGTYKIRGMPLEMKQIKGVFDQEDFYVSCQTKFQEQPLWLQLQMSLKTIPTACFLIKDHPEQKGLTIQFKKSAKEGWFCESAQGLLKGMTLHMQKEAGIPLYALQMTADLSEALPLLPKTWTPHMKKWGLGHGYSFHGSLALDPQKPFSIHSLKGDLSGKSFDLLGKTFSSLAAKVDFTANKGRIYNLKLEDELANLSIKTIDLTFNPQVKSWDVSSPLVYVKDFAPALFLKGRKERGMEIKNLSLYDLKGSLSNLESFEARGALFFSSLEKKEFSFWDAPLNLMKDWGLDPGLLTPVTGEADFVLKRGSFYFTALRNVYSDGKRSQFHLVEAGEDAYLSLDGSWHVDLSMKQNVVWKVTEDLILSIRGTVDKPKYSFKKSR